MPELCHRSADSRRETRLIHALPCLLLPYIRCCCNRVPYSSHRFGQHYSATTDLLLVDLQSVSVCHLERIWGISGLDALALEEKPDRSQTLALSLAEGGHELLELRAALDLEEDLVVVVGNLDVKVLGGGGLRGVASRASVFCVVGHYAG